MIEPSFTYPHYLILAGESLAAVRLRIEAALLVIPPESWPLSRRDG